METIRRTVSLRRWLVMAVFASVCGGALVEGRFAHGDQQPEAMDPFRRTMLQAEVALLRGDYDLAYERVSAALAMAKQFDPHRDQKMLGLVLCDMTRGEVHSAKGYFEQADDAFDGAIKKLTVRAVYWARQGWGVADLAEFNLRIGYAHLCKGDNDLAHERVDAIIADRPTKDRATEDFRQGVKFVQGVVNQGGGAMPEMAKELLNRCELRLARSLAMNDDAIGAEGHFAQAERFLKADRRWFLQFDPNGEQAIALQGKVGAAAPPVAPLAGMDPREKEAMELARFALAYIDLLSIKCEIDVASKPPRTHEAEVAASQARDIAEERFPGTAIYWQTLVTLAGAYCAGFEAELRNAKENPDAVVAIDGKDVNVHQKAAESYIEDIEDLIRRAKDASKDLNPRRPIHFDILSVERALAKFRKDGAKLLQLKAECKDLADRRSGDKPPLK